MPDPKFFTRAGPFTLGDIAAATGATCPPEQAGKTVDDVAPLDTAGPTHLAFMDNPKYRDQFKATAAAACLMHPDMAAHAPAGVVCLTTKNPYKSYALAAQMFYPGIMPDPGVHPRAVVDPSATIGQGCRIDANAVIGAGVSLGDRVWVEANAVIGDHVQIGANCRIGVGATVTHAIIGASVRLYPGVRVGQDGFGFAVDPRGHVKVPQLGRVIIGDFCEIGANTCIDRGAGPDTMIGMGTWIDGLVKIGHNVRIGRGCIIVAQVGISGSTVVDDFVAIGGQAGLAGHLHVGQGAQIAAGSGVIGDIDAGAVMMGYPALPKTQFMRHVAYLNRMTKRSSSS
jgi:UDP-3-O-[3-hydroxymyristoyl] glucosamine N-acyltransferase